MLFELVYASRAIDLAPGAIEEIVATARHFNAAHDITGALIYDGQYFIQFLEGDAGLLSNLYRRIASDVRHTDVVLLKAGSISRRHFGQWSMTAVAENHDVAALIRQYSATHVFDPYVLPRPAVTQLAVDVARLVGAPDVNTGPGQGNH